MTRAPYYADGDLTVYHGDCVAVLADLADSSIDAVCTDPPYNLAFMGRAWDDYGTGAGFQTWCTAWTAECFRVLKPGGHMVAFGGTRTWHRLACAVEDSGFAIRDSIAWMYGSGFPKSMDVSKAVDKRLGAAREVTGEHTGPLPGFGEHRFVSTDALRRDTPATDDAARWQGWGTALKPAFEPIVVGRKPFVGTVAGNVLENGVGALNIDGCRVGGDERTSTRSSGVVVSENGSMSGANYGRVPGPTVVGRWPPNVVVDESQAAEIDRQSGHTTSQRGHLTSTPGTIYGAGKGLPSWSGIGGYDDQGGASRFFPTFRYEAKAPGTERPTGTDGTGHPTVKPLDLMRWLVRLVTPRYGLVLDPFAGSGTTAQACLHEYMRCITIEADETYLPLIVARNTKAQALGLDFGELS